MGKIRLFLASLLALMAWSVPALADQYQIVYSPETGTYTETNPTGTYARTWVSTDAPHVTLKTSVNNINVADGGLYGQTYTLSVEGGYLIKSFVFTARPSDNSDGMSVTLENGTEYPVDPAGSRVRATDVSVFCFLSSVYLNPSSFILSSIDKKSIRHAPRLPGSLSSAEG